MRNPIKAKLFSLLPHRQNRKNRQKAVGALVLLAVFAGIAWYVSFRGLSEILPLSGAFKKAVEAEVSGYARREAGRAGENRVTALFEPSGHPDEHMERVVNGVRVTVTKYGTPEEAKEKIDEASRIYVGEWRTETVSGREANMGYLYDTETQSYTGAYLGWIEDGLYYEFIAFPGTISKRSDKEFLYQSLREIAEGIF